MAPLTRLIRPRKFLGQLRWMLRTMSSINPGLWDMVFGGGGTSRRDPGTLYLTAGGSNQPNFLLAGTPVKLSIRESCSCGCGRGARLFSQSFGAKCHHHARWLGQSQDQRGIGWRIQRTDFPQLFSSSGSDLRLQSFDDFSRCERFIHLDSLDRCGPSDWRLRDGSTAAWPGTVRYPDHDSQTKTACPQNNSVDEPAGYAASGLASQPRMQQ